jgi:hypothetical protein
MIKLKIVADKLDAERPGAGTAIAVDGLRPAIAACEQGIAPVEAEIRGTATNHFHVITLLSDGHASYSDGAGHTHALNHCAHTVESAADTAAVWLIEVSSDDCPLAHGVGAAGDVDVENAFLKQAMSAEPFWRSARFRPASAGAFGCAGRLPTSARPDW